MSPTGGVAGDAMGGAGGGGGLAAGGAAGLGGIDGRGGASTTPFTITPLSVAISADLHAVAIAPDRLYVASANELHTRIGDTWSVESLPPGWTSKITDLAIDSDGRLVLAGKSPGSVWIREAAGWVGATYDVCVGSGIRLATAPGGVLFGGCAGLIQVAPGQPPISVESQSVRDLVYVAGGASKGLHVLLGIEIAFHSNAPFPDVASVGSGSRAVLPMDAARPFFSFSSLAALSDGSLIAVGGSGLVAGNQTGEWVWETTTMSPPIGTLARVAAAGATAVAVGTNGLLMIREKGQWSTVPLPTPNHLYSVRVEDDGSRFVAVGAQGAIVEGRR